MAAVDANLYICAGGFNATDQVNPARLQIIKDRFYQFYGSDAQPTVYDDHLTTNEGADAEPLPVKTDYIFVKGYRERQIDINKKKLNQKPLEEFDRPSNHLAIAAKINLPEPPF